MNTKIAIQGIEGSFHHQVVLENFDEQTEIVACNSFDALAASVIGGEAAMGVMALENSIAGSIIPNHALIDHHNLYITGEYYLNIHQYLMAFPGQEISGIREVHSHPMALLQCKAFFRKYPHIKLVEAMDTAETARRICEEQLKGIAAIAGKKAADIYRLSVLASQIQTIKNNATRFVVVVAPQHSAPQYKADTDKASLKFELEHKRGSLAAVLNVMSDCKLDLTKIQSLPRIETPWKYAFFVDVTFKACKDYEKAVRLLSIMTDHLKVLGTYKNALVS